jgi:hypothetical protein
MVSLNCFGDRNSCDVEEKEVWEGTHLFFFLSFEKSQFDNWVGLIRARFQAVIRAYGFQGFFAAASFSA